MDHALSSAEVPPRATLERSIAESGQPWDAILSERGSRQTDQGTTIAAALKDLPTFADLTDRMRSVGEKLGSYTGNKLKSLIYAQFKREVADQPLGRRIR